MIRSIFLLIFLFIFRGTDSAGASSAVFPPPTEMAILQGNLQITESTKILLPPNPSKHDVFLSRLLVAELGDRHHIPILAVEKNDIPETGTFIVMGTQDNPLINKVLEQNNKNLAGSELKGTCWRFQAGQPWWRQIAKQVLFMVFRPCGNCLKKAEKMSFWRN